MYKLYSGIYIIAILCTCIQMFYVVSNKRMPRIALRNYTIACVLVIFTGAVNWGAELLDGSDMKFYFLHGLLKAIEHTLAPYLFVRFADFVGRRKSREVLIGIFVFNGILQVTSLFTRLTFYIDGNNYYQHGKFFYVVYICSLISLIYTIHVYMDFAKKYKNKNNIVLYMLGIYEIIVVMLHLFAINVSLDYIGTMLTMILIYIYLDDFNKQRNEETIANQLSLMEALSEDYDCVLDVKLDNHLFETIRLSETFSKKLGERFNKEITVETALEAYASLMVYHHDLELFRTKSNIERIIEELKTSRQYVFEYRAVIDGKIRYCSMRVAKMEDPYGVTHLIVALEDVDDQKNRWENLVKMSSTDQMTGLYNRRAYNEEVDKIDGLSMEDKVNICGIMIDLNGLKRTNDTLGHEAGDELIISSANIISDVFEDSGKVFRLGGDEFAVITDINRSGCDAKIVDLRDRMANWYGKYIDSMSASIGVAGFDDVTENVGFEKIIKIADQRMYQDKKEYYKTHDRRNN